MPICPFATQVPITGGVGPYTGGPFKIVHHTTEGSTRDGAFAAFRANRSDPHFTVDHAGIYQHINTSIAARSLRNAAGGVETNKDSALQIEVVGFAHLLKNPATLRNVARLCRWLEQVHSVSAAWPNGLPKVATPGGHDPGGHNRNAVNWNTKSGHFGHCHVPENTHWDPGYTIQEVNFLMGAEFDGAGDLENRDLLEHFHAEILERREPHLEGVASTMNSRVEIDLAEEYERY